MPRSAASEKKLHLTIRAVMLDEHVDLVAGDFNGAASRRQTSNGNLSIFEEAFADSDSRCLHTVVRLTCSARWLGRRLRISRPRNSHERWKVRQHGAFSIFHHALGLRRKEVWIHLASVDHHGDYEPRTVGSCTFAENRADLETNSLLAHRLRRLRQWSELVLNQNERLATGDKEHG